MSNISFESEVVFPEHPFYAAVMFFAVIAYPEKGAGQPGGAGSKFAQALVDHYFWSCSKVGGLRNLRERRNDSSYTAPNRREFEGAFDRGFRRIVRRITAYELFGTQLLNSFFTFNVSNTSELNGISIDVDLIIRPAAFRSQLWQHVTPSARSLISNQRTYWSEKFEINKTGVPADTFQKSKDVYRRAFLPSLPVLHLVHGLNECIPDDENAVECWKEIPPIIMMLSKAETWIWEALRLAEMWQKGPHFPGSCVDSDRLIKLSWSRCHEKAEVWPT